MLHIIKSPLSALLIAFLLISISSCTQVVATPTATVAPTATSTPTATPAPTLQPGDSERKLTVNDQARTYLIHIPSGLDRNHPVPVVLAFHDYYDTASVFAPSTGFDDIADKNSFIVVYPNGIGNSWNAGGCCRYAVEKNVDDIAFVRQILSDLETIASLDPKRVYAAGFSNGGMLSYRLACEMSDMFAAIASVSGNFFYSPCQPEQPVSLIHVHGLMDTTIPYSGGQGDTLTNVIFPPTEQGITTWVQLDSCTGSPQVEKEKIFTHTSYTSCESGTAVELYTMEAGGHAWPSKYVWDASQIIWDFFAAHPKP